MMRIVTIRETVHSAQARAGRAFAYTNSRGSFFQRLALGVLLLAGAILVLAIVIPVILILLAIGILGYLWLRVKVWFHRSRQPHGPLNGRRNVKVRDA
jgi:hypothetical protein